MTPRLMTSRLEVAMQPARGEATALIPSTAIERLWSRLHDAPGHLLVLGAAGQGKTSALRVLQHRGKATGLPVHSDRRAPLVPGGVLLLDDAHHLPTAELGDLCVRARDAGTTVVMAARPDRAWRHRLQSRDSEVAISVTALRPWGPADVLAACVHDPGLTPDLADRLVTDTAGMPWLVTAAGRGDSDLRVLDRMRDLPDDDIDLLLELACGLPRADARRSLEAASTADPDGDTAHDRLIAAGLLAYDATIPPLVRRAVLRRGPRHRLADTLRVALDGTTDAGASLRDDVVDELVAAGVRHARLTSALERSADDALPTDPARAAVRYGAAIGAGADPCRLSVKRAEALCLAGSVAEAVAAVDSTSPTPTAPYLRVATTALLLARQPGRAAALWRWALEEGVDGLGSLPRSVGAYALLGVGATDPARMLLRSSGSEPPTSEASLMRRVTEAVAASLVGDGRAALPLLVEAAAASAGLRRAMVLPDHPAALAAMICLGSGDVAMAESILSRAALVATNRVDRSRLSALRGWVAMASGRFNDAETHLADIDPAIPRDEPWQRAIRIGLARRRDDLVELARLWSECRGELLGHPEDLYSLLPLGELGLAGARMRDQEVVDAAWGRAADLVARAGDPPAWSATFHWYGVQAAILSERPSALAPHATSLVQASRTSPYAARLALAAQSWVAALGGRADAAQVEAAARALGQVGQAWEGARLAAHAAARAGSKRDSGLLMECARDLRGAQPETEPGALRAATGTPSAVPGGIELSPREREVVQLVLAGLTYREIGARLFLSAKTVEHHMARIKRRSDAVTRGELLQQLALTLGALGTPPTAP